MMKGLLAVSRTPYCWPRGRDIWAGYYRPHIFSTQEIKICFLLLTLSGRALQSACPHPPSTDVNRNPSVRNRMANVRNSALWSSVCNRPHMHCRTTPVKGLSEKTPSENRYFEKVFRKCCIFLKTIVSHFSFLHLEGGPAGPKATVDHFFVGLPSPPLPLPPKKKSRLVFTLRAD